MRAFLPPGWYVQAPSYAMVALGGTARPVNLPDGYRLEVQSGPQAGHVFVLASEGELAASGHLGIGERAAVAIES